MEVEFHLATGQSATASTPASGVTFGVPPGFMDASGQTASGAPTWILWFCR